MGHAETLLDPECSEEGGDSRSGKGPFDSTRVQNIHIENSTFHAPMRIDKAKAITLINNRFHCDVKVGKCATLKMNGNQRNEKPFTIKKAN